MKNSSELDQFDLAIIQVLSTQGRLPVTDLAKRVGLTKTPCQIRLKKLQNAGYILGFRAVLNPAKLSRENVAFVEVKLSDTSETALAKFNAAVMDIPEIEMCHMIAGAFDYLLKIRTEDMASYRQVLGETISQLPFVNNTSTHVSMQSVKDNAF